MNFRSLICRTVSLPMASVTIGLLLAACSSSLSVDNTATTEPTSDFPEEITVCLYADVTTLDIRIQTTLNARTIAGNIQDKLIATRGPEMNLVPQLAVSWENIDPLTWRLHLREDVKFTNGEPFDAEAVKYSIESQKAGRGTVRNYLDAITEVRVVDTYTVDLITNEPNVLTIRNLTMVYMFPPEYGQQMGENFSEHPIGTGPYQFVEWVEGDHVTLEANPDYWDTTLWGGPSPVKTVVFRVCPEASTRVAMMRNGEVDLIDNIPPELMPELADDPNVNIISFRGFKRVFLRIDAREGISPPLDDARVREALNYAIDRESIATNLLSGYATTYTGFAHNGMASQNMDLEAYPYDPERAQALLAEAGYPTGFETNLYTPVGIYLKDLEIAEVIQAQLSEVGINAELIPMEWADYAAKFYSIQLDGLVIDARRVNTGDPVDAYLYMLDSKGGVPYISDPEFDAMLAQANSMFNLDERNAYLRDTVEPYIWYEMIPEVALFDLVDTYAVSSRLIWHPVNPQEAIDLRGLGLTGWPTP